MDPLLNLRREIELLKDRLSTLENSLLEKRSPSVRPATKVWTLIAGVGCLIAIVLSVSSFRLRAGEWEYERDGVPAEVLAGIPAAIAAIVALREHQQDKDLYND